MIVCKLCGTEDSPTWWRCCLKHIGKVELAAVCRACAIACFSSKKVINMDDMKCDVDIGIHDTPYWKEKDTGMLVCNRHKKQYEERETEFGPFDWEEIKEETKLEKRWDKNTKFENIKLGNDLL